MLREITRYHVVYKKVNLTMADGQQAVNVACFCVVVFFVFFFVFVFFSFTAVPMLVTWI